MNISKEEINEAIQCLIDNGIEEDEAEIVLQALGYILLDAELFPEEYIPSAENGDYGPSNPWDAPGMSIKDFI